jgi:hypothetical protein
VIVGDISWIHSECESKEFINRNIERTPGWARVFIYEGAG